MATLAAYERCSNSGETPTKQQICESPAERQAQIWAAFERCSTIEAKSRFTVDDAADENVELPPVLLHRDRAVTTLQAAAPSLTSAEAHRIAIALTDDVNAVELAGATLAGSSLSADAYLDAYHARADEVLQSDIRVVSRLPLIVAQDLASHFDA